MEKMNEEMESKIRKIVTEIVKETVTPEKFAEMQQRLGELAKGVSAPFTSMFQSLALSTQIVPVLLQVIKEQQILTKILVEREEHSLSIVDLKKAMDYYVDSFQKMIREEQAAYMASKPSIGGPDAQGDSKTG